MSTFAKKSNIGPEKNLRIDENCETGKEVY